MLMARDLESRGETDMVEDDARSDRRAPEPNPALRSFDVLVGVWEVSGSAMMGLGHSVGLRSSTCGR